MNKQKIVFTENDNSCTKLNIILIHKVNQKSCELKRRVSNLQIFTSTEIQDPSVEYRQHINYFSKEAHTRSLPAAAKVLKSIFNSIN